MEYNRDASDSNKTKQIKNWPAVESINRALRPSLWLKALDYTLSRLHYSLLEFRMSTHIYLDRCLLARVFTDEGF